MPAEHPPSLIPETFRYTSEHEWAEILEDGAVRVGITHHAQDALGDVVFVQVPEPGTLVAAGDACGEVESTKSVSDLTAPLSGTVVLRNHELDSDPGLVNRDPYGAGWLFVIQAEDVGEFSILLDAAAYALHTG